MEEAGKGTVGMCDSPIWKWQSEEVTDREQELYTHIRQLQMELEWVSWACLVVARLGAVIGRFAFNALHGLGSVLPEARHLYSDTSSIRICCEMLPLSLFLRSGVLIQPTSQTDSITAEAVKVLSIIHGFATN
jgi:hypothetical protein